MRLLPKSRRGRVGVAVGLAALLALYWYVGVYRPWEAHYRGIPTSRFAALTVELCDYLEGVDRPHPLRDCPAALRPWLYEVAFARVYCAYDALAAGDPEALPVIVELLRWPDPRVREEAVLWLEWAVGKGGDARAAVPALVELLESADAGAPELAARGLIAIGPAARPAVPALLRVRGDRDRDVWTRWVARCALGRIDRDALEAYERDHELWRDE